MAVDQKGFYICRINREEREGKNAETSKKNAAIKDSGFYMKSRNKMVVQASTRCI
jgi:hypothetical protein